MEFTAGISISDVSVCILQTWWGISQVGRLGLPPHSIPIKGPVKTIVGQLGYRQEEGYGEDSEPIIVAHFRQLHQLLHQQWIVAELTVLGVHYAIYPVGDPKKNAPDYSDSRWWVQRAHFATTFSPVDGPGNWVRACQHFPQCDCTPPARILEHDLLVEAAHCPEEKWIQLPLGELGLDLVAAESTT